jgi:hypothetical protein
MLLPRVQYTSPLAVAVQPAILPTLLASVVVSPAWVTKRSALFP